MSVFEFAQELIIDSGAFIRNRMIEAFQVNSKSNPNDLVTTVDLETEKYIRDKISETYPDHNIVGEEFETEITDSKTGYLWIVDPIDGTLNFVHQKENFAISIGIYRDGEPYAGFILDVMKNDLFYARCGKGAYKNNNKLEPLEETHLSESLIGVSHKWLMREGIKEALGEIVKQCRSPRSFGSAALEYAQLIEGKIDGALFFRLSPWDFSGGKIIGNEIGILTTDLLGRENEWLKRTSILAANKTLHKEITGITTASESFKETHDTFHKIGKNDSSE